MVITYMSILKLLKGLIMDRCVLFTSTPEWVVVLRRRAITRAQPKWSPRGETTHEGVDVNNTHLSMIKPDYNMMLAISVTIYQYSAYLNKLKLESRAIVVSIAMSPRNLGGKYRCRPTPRGESARASFFREPERVNRTASEWRHRLHDDNIVDHVVCL